MVAEPNKAISRRIIEDVWNKGTMSVVDEVVAPDVVLHDPSGPTGEQHGREAIKQLVTSNRAAFPDLHFTIELQGIPPTGKQVTWTGIVMQRFAGGKLVETWPNVDNLGVLQQLGVIPQMASSGA